MAPPLDLGLPTALILIDNQSGFCHPSTVSHWGSSRSNPLYEVNIQSLLSAARSHASSAASTPVEVIHVFHSSTTQGSPLHPNHPAQGIRPLEFATPAADGSEPVFWKSVNSSFIGTDLAAHLQDKGIRQLLIAGLTTDHCVSTTVRMAANLGVVDRSIGAEWKGGGLFLWLTPQRHSPKGGFDAETVHHVSVASLEGEFADILGTEEVVQAFCGGSRGH
ncbi:hypothetical protein N7510_003399 [Penicillium lagena]|uniref:uncharacterized protein n=1 Tax=Penicillium lagena TaxID=94218 RepID=UPI002541026B|nr:uncharacterized protein N7510_003399 [Penicillium lagena]KAJ5619415.1 hypothetical protein N7510_003399 [Penicillium lagena]